MAVIIQAGVIGSVEPYAINGFEDMPIGPLNGNVELLGKSTSGACDFEDAELGSRE